MTDATFLDLVDQLTRTHPVTVQRDTGTEIRNELGLLAQLREAVFSGMEGGSGAAFGSKPPIDASALDLLEEITTQATEALARVSTAPTPYGHAEDYVRLWAGQTDYDAVMIVSVRSTADADPEDPLKPLVFRELREVTAFQLVRSWVERVKDFFNPPSMREIGAPCPLCAERYVWKSKDGNMIRGAALSFIRDKETGETIEARCGNTLCSGSWPPDKFEWLARAIGSIKEGETIEEVLEREGATRR